MQAAGRWVSDMWSWRNSRPRRSIAWCAVVMTSKVVGIRIASALLSAAHCVTAPSFVSTKILVYSTRRTCINNDMWGQVVAGHTCQWDGSSFPSHSGGINGVSQVTGGCKREWEPAPPLPRLPSTACLLRSVLPLTDGTTYVCCWPGP
jgi:hypothetical protein